MSDDFDTAVKLAVYRITAETGTVPDAHQIARATGKSEEEVLAAFGRLHQKRLLVPELNDSARLRMAPPFSGIPSDFPVDANGIRYYANCVWDAYGIAAALHSDAVIPARDGHTGESLTLRIEDGRPVLQPYVAHFAVPAAQWWNDIVFT